VVQVVVVAHQLVVLFPALLEQQGKVTLVGTVLTLLGLITVVAAVVLDQMVQGRIRAMAVEGARVLHPLYPELLLHTLVAEAAADSALLLAEQVA
jgi:hypothetical protein